MATWSAKSNSQIFFEVHPILNLLFGSRFLGGVFYVKIIAAITNGMSDIYKAVYMFCGDARMSYACTLKKAGEGMDPSRTPLEKALKVFLLYDISLIPLQIVVSLYLMLWIFNLISTLIEMIYDRKHNNN